MKMVNIYINNDENGSMRHLLLSLEARASRQLCLRPPEDLHQHKK